MAEKNANRRIDVLGSVNVDLVARVAALPAPGETVAGGDISVLLGGKGANQAIATARAGGDVAMWGAVGAESFGLRPMAEIAASGVDVAGMATVEGPTGAALIGVDAKGENNIIVSPGANAHAPEAIDLKSLSGGWLLAQMELPPAFVALAFTAAKARGARTILNAAPALPAPDGLFEATDILIVNETELARYSGRPLDSQSDDDLILDAAKSIRAREDQIIIATLGARGALTLTPAGPLPTIAPRAEALDTTGAGDCFCGALVARLADGAGLDAALAFAAQAAAISVGRRGAAASMPTRDEIDAALGG